MTKTGALIFQKECEEGALQLRQNLVYVTSVGAVSVLEKIDRLETTAALLRQAILNSDPLVSETFKQPEVPA